MARLLTVRLVTVDGHQYANLGSGDLARALTAQLEATNGGHHITPDGEVLYYNGGADGTPGAYQHLVDVALDDR